jgi:transcriptional regulator with XRE-family HTH domain
LGVTQGRQKFFLKEWRLYRGLTQARLAERIGVAKSAISHLEKGVRRYNQDQLEALAEALNCEPADLVMRDPTDSDSIWSLWDRAQPGERAVVVDMLRALANKRTGTE